MNQQPKHTKPACKRQQPLMTGISLHVPHMKPLLDLCQEPSSTILPSWVEVIADNVMYGNSAHCRLLDKVVEHFPVALHGVGLSLGSIDPLDHNHLRRLKRANNRYECLWISEHAAFVSVDRYQFHDLLPLPYTEEALMHLAQRVAEAQDILGQRLLIENAASYVSYPYSTLTDAEFMSELADRADCDLLVDLTNLYVNECNHGWPVDDFFNTVTPSRIKELHLAGCDPQEQLVIDSHDRPIPKPVWDIFNTILPDQLNTPTLVEWDNQLPELTALLREAELVDMHKKDIIDNQSYSALEPVSAKGEVR